jgi:hypothetical protein
VCFASRNAILKYTRHTVATLLPVRDTRELFLRVLDIGVSDPIVLFDCIEVSDVAEVTEFKEFTDDTELVCVRWGWLGRGSFGGGGRDLEDGQACVEEGGKGESEPAVESLNVGGLGDDGVLPLASIDSSNSASIGATPYLFRQVSFTLATVRAG